MKEKYLDAAGSCVDEIFLAPGRVIARLQAMRHVDWQRYAADVEFYHEQGYVKNSATFFSLPAEIPDYRVENESPYKNGLYQVVAFGSSYEPRNPSVRERYRNYPENRTGYVIRWIHGDRPRKTVLCSHGFMMGSPREAERMFKIRKLFSMGLDVALCIHPFHWKRIAGPRSARRIYLTLGDTAFTNECVAHSIHDLESSFLILRKFGATEIGLIGASLGGYISGLYAGLSRRPAFVAMMVPALSFLYPISPDMLYRKSPFDGEWRIRARQAAEFHSPLNFNPQIPADNILLVASRGDKICPFGPVEELSKRWGLSHFQRRTGGHWLVFDNKRGSAWYEFLAEKNFIFRKK